jgi:hypothetical protein
MIQSEAERTITSATIDKRLESDAVQTILDLDIRKCFLTEFCKQAEEESKEDAYKDVKKFLKDQREAIKTGEDPSEIREKHEQKWEDTPNILHGEATPPPDEPSLFVPANEVECTDWDEIRAVQDTQESKYVAKNRKIPMYAERRNIIYKNIQTHDGLTMQELLEKVKPFGIKKTPAYDHVKNMIREGSVYLDSEKRLHINGRPRPLIAEWKAHNIYWKLAKAREPWAIAQFCEYLNKVLFAGRDIEALPNPTNWREQNSKSLREFRIKCTDEPLTYEELLLIRKAMKDFFGYIPRFRIKAELNQDTEGGEKMITDYLQLSYLGRTMRTYCHKNKNGKKVKRKEIHTPYMEMQDMREHMKEKITIFESINEKQRLTRLLKEERKRSNKLECELKKRKKN